MIPRFGAVRKHHTMRTESTFSAVLMTNQRPSKGYFTEVEAAKALDLNLPQFRTLVRRHILVPEDELANLAMTSFQPSDLVLLRLLATSLPLEEAVAVR